MAITSAIDIVTRWHAQIFSNISNFSRKLNLKMMSVQHKNSENSWITVADYTLQLKYFVFSVFSRSYDHMPKMSGLIPAVL